MKFFPRRAGLAIALLALIVSASFISSNFLNPINILNVLRQVALYGILGVGMTFVILTKGIDLSFGSTVALVGVVGALLMEHGVAIPLVVPICLVLGAVVGAANGFGVSYGLGVEYAFTPQWSALLQYESHKMKFAGGADERIGMTSIGVRYRY